MSDNSWDAAMTELAAAQRNFMNGDATGLQALYSHRDDVTVMGGFGGFELGWAEVGPRLAWAASHFRGGEYSQQNISMTVGRDVACLVCLERWARNPQRRPARTDNGIAGHANFPAGERAMAPRAPPRGRAGAKT